VAYRVWAFWPTARLIVDGGAPEDSPEVPLLWDGPAQGQPAGLQGFEAVDACLTAVRLRLRPIFMTSMAFILGVMPLVAASGAGANARHSVGTGVAGGMIFDTLLAIIFVPLFYYLIMQAKKRASNRAGTPEVPVHETVAAQAPNKPS
jgi:hypothetical protein